MPHLSTILDYVYLAIGFGLVIFIHELGHFLAAKYSDVRVDQFAVGLGPAVVSWRKGMGSKWGSSGAEMEKIRESPSQAELARVGETEYRLNWIPFGGYVKMLGQDDLRPGAVAEDPRAYNNKSIRARMLIVSAGVIMNVILAAVGFMIVFLVGYPVPPARVGGVVSLSPAMQTVNASGARDPLVSGDEILSINGKKTIGDFSKIQLVVALSEDGDTLPIEVRRLDGKVETVYAKPARPGDDSRGLLAIGITLPSELAGLDPKIVEDWDPAEIRQTLMPDTLALAPGEIITQINGKPVRVNEYWKLDQALADSNGNPIELTIQSPDGKISQRSILPHFQGVFGKDQMDFLGMIPRAMVNMIQDDSPALGKLKPGDVILAVEGGSDRASNPSPEQLRTILSSAGAKQVPVDLTVLSLGDSQPHTITGIVPSVRIGNGRIGLGIGIGYYDERHLVVAQVLPDTPASGKIPPWATLTAINGQAISTWFDVQRIIAAAKPDDVLEIAYQPYSEVGSAVPAVAAVKVSASDVANAQMVSYASDLQLRPAAGTMKTSNPLIALEWGVGETRDAILELYVTLERMFTGDVSVRNVLGPVGMFQAGAAVAGKGISWLLWFLANISANLAVVNFLPVPIFDGGLFTLLILEKIQGKPLSQEMQKIVQTVGLVLILGLFLLVTYQDIARMAGFAN